MSKKDYPRKALSHDNYRSDSWILRIFMGWFDPCPLNPHPEVNGLLGEWGMKTYVNPPYSNPLPWVKKAIFESKKGKLVVMLLKHDSSTEWYRLLHEAGAKFLLINERLKHQTGKSAAFPSVLVVLSSGTTIFD
jgi:hypothetical protein